VSNHTALPEAGLLRLKSIVGSSGLIPISKSTWWAGVKAGRFPKPIKLGPRITAWRVEDIRSLVDRGVQPLPSSNQVEPGKLGAPAALMCAMPAKTIAMALGGRKAGGGWIARCPAHDDREPSLSIRDADDSKVLVRCHAGCDQERVIAALRLRGLWEEKGHRRLMRPALRVVSNDLSCRDDTKRTDAALAIWRPARLANVTLLETYLDSRGLHLPLPPTLRFHAGLKHPSGGIWPAMIALVTRGSDETPLAIHRTFLTRDGKGKAPVQPNKMMLGPCRGGAVRLAPADRELMVGEGIETCLAAMQATGNPAWSALSTSGLRALDLPAVVSDVIVLADGDGPGEAAACDCARRWKQEGRRARIARPPQGMDFNDLLLGGARRAEERAA
jgi:putative DNA primase/helicase